MARPTLIRPPETTPTPDTYVTIYNQTIQYPQATKAFSFDLTTPPLIIEFGVEPKMITRTKHAKSDYGKREYKDYKPDLPERKCVVCGDGQGPGVWDDCGGRGFWETLQH